MKTFEEVLEQYEPMISACIRKLNIYKNHEMYKQAGRIALWKAWQRFDEEKGDFTPYAYRSMYGAMLDELKKEKHQEEHVHVVEDEKLTFILEKSLEKNFSNEALEIAIENLSENERKLLLWIFVEGISLSEAAVRVGITIPGIKKRRLRLLRKLRERLSGAIL